MPPLRGSLHGLLGAQPKGNIDEDAMTLDEWEQRFASVIDSGLFHVYDGDERQKYVRGLAHVLRPGGRLFLYCFAEGPFAPGGGLSQADLCDAFAEGWLIESLDYDVGGELNPAFAAEYPDAFPQGEPKMWFAIIRRE
jgi:SAM-dependent methyltransferase